MPVNRAEWTHPDLLSLIHLFYEEMAEFGEFQEIAPEQLPQPHRRLLAHTSHMTVTMEAYHGCAVELEVLQRRVTDTHYARQIVLRRESDGAIVQHGIVRLATSLVTGDVRAEIEEESAPLGRILIDHGVLRTVKLMSTWQIVPGPALKKLLQPAEPALCYGRTALIYTDRIPAVELLEIVGPV